jgi:hypothetical protein
MYCIHCGADGAAAFCSKCGISQNLPASSSESGKTITPATDVIAKKNWATSLDYHRLLACEEPRQRIVAASKRSQPGVTGEDVLAILDAASITKVSLSHCRQRLPPMR